LVTLALAASLLGGGRDVSVALPAEDAILPLEGYTQPDAQALAREHAAELGVLQTELRRCAPGLQLERHGIGFRHPQRVAGATPYLTLWVWLDRIGLPRGADLAGRAGGAFRRFGQPLVRRLIARTQVFTDQRVGGYGLILTWLGPRTGERLIAESLALFADKVTAANFAHDTIAPDVFLSRAAVRVFDGQKELPSLRLVGEDAGAPFNAAPC